MTRILSLALVLLALGLPVQAQGPVLQHPPPLQLGTQPVVFDRMGMAPADADADADAAARPMPMPMPMPAPRRSKAAPWPKHR